MYHNAEPGAAAPAGSGARPGPPPRTGAVPPPVFASPADLHTGRDPGVHPPADDEMWWTPGVRDIARAVGWWWLILAPTLAILTAGLLTPVLLGWWGLVIPLSIAGIKTGLFLGGVTASIIALAFRRATSARKDPFCIHCGYGLAGLDENGTCPECGRPYVRGIIDEYRKDPRFFRQRYRAAHRPVREQPIIDVGEHSAPSPDGT